MKILLNLLSLSLLLPTALAAPALQGVPEGATSFFDLNAYFKASNTGDCDLFGDEVVLEGDTLVVGAAGEWSGATGINGDQSDDSAEGAGAVYVFVRTGGVWTQQAYLKASNTDEGDRFGSEATLSGDTLVIGAQREDSSAAGVNGDESDNSMAEAGAAYVFVRNAGVWTQQAYLKASNPGAGDRFGGRMDLDGDTLVIASAREDSNATGINGDQSDNFALDSGAAYVFVRSGTTWTQQAYVKASNTGADDAFGTALSLSGNTLLIGAEEEDSAATGVNGNQADNSAPDAGAAYVFVRSGTTWSQQAYLKASNTDAGDRLGESASLLGDTLVVSAELEGSSATGVNGDQADNSAPESGAAYVFVRSGTTWTQQAYLKASNTETEDRFGDSAALTTDRLAIGAFNEASAGVGVNHLPLDNSADNSGAAYVFERSGNVWGHVAYVKAHNTSQGDQFGGELDMDGDSLVVGAQCEESNTTGVNSVFNDDGDESGAAYLYSFNDGFGRWADVGGGTAGVAGVPSLSGTGALTSGSPISITLEGAAPSAPCLLWISLTSTPTQFFGGTVHALPYAVQLQLNTNGAGGFATSPAPFPAVPAGTELWFQFLIADATAVSGISLSNGLRATTD